MTAIPAASEFTGSTITEAQFKTAQTNLLSFLSGLLGSDGTFATALSTLGALGGKASTKTGAYTLLSVDRGTVFLCSGTWTLTLTAAATLANGFTFSVVNTGSGAITIDPNASELIDGAATKILSAGQSCDVVCNGSGFYTISGAGAGFPSGTLMLFAQTSAPTGWTKSSTHNDKTLRVVSGTAGSGGSVAFSTVFGRTAVDGHVLTVAEMPSHSHVYNSVISPTNNSPQMAANPDRDLVTTSTTAVGGNSSHNHTADLRVQYVDVIIASKD